MSDDDAQEETKTTREVAEAYLQTQHGIGVSELGEKLDDDPSSEMNRLTFERDLAVRQAKLAEADLKVTRLALEENRPLEALRQINEAIERIEEELEGLEGVFEGGDNGGDAA